MYKREFFKAEIFEKPKEIEVTQSTLEIKKNVKEAVFPIFMYHNITDDLSYIEFSENAVSPNSLEQQLKEIKENNYDSIFISEINNLSSYKKPVVLTFDDGFEDFYKNAFPLLKKYNIKATLFVIVGYINCPLYCTLEELKEMYNSGLVEIESHTQSHINLANANKEKQTEEISSSTELLNQYLNKNSNSVFCYPYGAYNEYTIDIVKEKYNYAVIMGNDMYEYDKNENYLIPRITVCRSTNIYQFRNYLERSNVELE